MADFQLDTSGAVWVGLTATQNFTPLNWSDLSPFAQGYVEAAFNEWQGVSEAGFYGFADLAPETLAAMLQDCDRAQEVLTTLFLSPEEAGAALWRERQLGRLPDFPPLALYLGDDGKIYQREATR